jgi:hypothetical protein
VTTIERCRFPRVEVPASSASWRTADGVVMREDRGPWCYDAAWPWLPENRDPAYPLRNCPYCGRVLDVDEHDTCRGCASHEDREPEQLAMFGARA